MRIVKDGWGLIIGSLIIGLVLAFICRLAGWNHAAIVMAVLGVCMSAFMVYFFRDPERVPPAEDEALVAGADGLIRAIETIQESRFLGTETVRISIFLNPFDVHVNRAPMGGQVTHLSYTPGRHILTLQNASSELNEHSSILIEGEKTKCLVKQIVGPIVRRVIYWLEVHQRLGKGDRIGMMKFGSRLDMYFPKKDVIVIIHKGDRVRAGETIVARLIKG